jgi:hypothetical protein
MKEMEHTSQKWLSAMHVAVVTKIKFKFPIIFRTILLDFIVNMCVLSVLFCL